MLVNNFESRRIYFYFSEQTKVEKKKIIRKGKMNFGDKIVVK